MREESFTSLEHLLSLLMPQLEWSISWWTLPGTGPQLYIACNVHTYITTGEVTLALAKGARNLLSDWQ